MNQTLIALLIAVAPAILLAQLPDYVPTQNLVGWYPFDGDAENFGGTSSDGTVYGATAAVNRFDDVNSALSFDGSNDYVEIPHSEELLIGGGSATWALWCKIPNVSHGLQSPLITNYVTPTTPLFGLYVGGVNEGDYEGRVQIHYRTNSAGSEVGCQSDFRVDDNGWHHIAGVLDADQDSLLLYIDGILAATRYALAGSPDSYQSIVLGGNHLGRFFEVAIDDVGIWSQALPADQIQALFDGSVPPSDPIEDMEQGCELFNIQEIALQNLILMDSILVLSAALEECEGADAPDGEGNDSNESWLCGAPFSYQGHDYATVEIDGQCWFSENLMAENYRNGDAILSGLNDVIWSNSSVGAFAAYGASCSSCVDFTPEGVACGNEDIVSLFGLLYNQYAVLDSRGLCPSGWHVPSISEYNDLSNFLGGVSVAGAQMKKDMYWMDSESDNTIGNSSGFSALPVGVRHDTSAQCRDAGKATHIWTSDANRDVVLVRMVTSLLLNWSNPKHGFAVRCIKDQ